MIGVLGAKRVFTIVILVGINALLAASVYLYIMPQLQKQERMLRSMRSQASTVQADIDRMRIEYDQFQDQQERFEEYKKDGFFKPQDRRQAEELFKIIQKKSGVSLAAVAVTPAEIEKNQDAEKAEYKVLKSTIQIRIEALDDVDVSHYLYLVENFFPGHVTVEEVMIQRDAEITGTVLRAIAGGKNFPLVQAAVKMTWRTMIPASQVIVEEEG